MEIWKPVGGYEGLYEVSNLGRVKSLRKIRKLNIKKLGYSNININFNGKYKTYLVHRLVAKAFIPNPDNLPLVCHKDETLINGILDNSVGNLFWGTHKDNMRDMINKGRDSYLLSTNHPMKGKFGKDNHLSKSVKQYSKDGNFIKIWDSMEDVQRELGIQSTNISTCCRGKLNNAGGFVWEYFIQ